MTHRKENIFLAFFGALFSTMHNFMHLASPFKHSFMFLNIKILPRYLKILNIGSQIECHVIFLNIQTF